MCVSTGTVEEYVCSTLSLFSPSTHSLTIFFSNTNLLRQVIKSKKKRDEGRKVNLELKRERDRERTVSELSVNRAVDVMHDDEGRKVE